MALGGNLHRALPPVGDTVPIAKRPAEPGARTVGAGRSSEALAEAMRAGPSRVELVLALALVAWHLAGCRGSQEPAAAEVDKAPEQRVVQGDDQAVAAVDKPGGELELGRAEESVPSAGNEGEEPPARELGDESEAVVVEPIAEVAEPEDEPPVEWNAQSARNPWQHWALLLDRRLEASGLAAGNGSDLYLVAEKMHKVVRLDAETWRAHPPIHLERLREGAELEGIAYYEGQLYLCDEVNKVLYRLDASGAGATTEVEELRLDFEVDARNDEGGSGGDRRSLEGLAVDSLHPAEADARIYLLDEWDALDGLGAAGMLYVADLVGTEVRRLEGPPRPLPLPDPDDWRYTDLAWAPNGDLLALRTKYGEYQIVNLDEPGAGAPFDIKAAVNPWEEKGYSTNLEGLALIGSTVYVVSDNYQRGDDDLTLMLAGASPVRFLPQP